MLNISRLTCRIMGRTLIEDSSVQILDGWRVGLVGANGAGKSTLFRLITGEQEVDSGELSLSARQRIGIVKQNMPDTDRPLLELVLEADAERTQLLAACESEADPEKLGDIYERLNEIEAYSAPARAATILAGLGFTEAQVNGPFNALSGGWRMRVALAAVLFQQPEMLLLDEPTNHLDLEAIIWLEGYLASYPHTIIIISHDREILNRSVNHIIHLHDKKLTHYNGNYDTFERTRAEKMELQQKLHEKQSAQRAHIQSFVDRFRAKASKARQAQSRIKMLEKMDVVDAVVADRSTRFAFPQPEKVPQQLIVLNDVNIGYGGKTILHKVNDIIDRDDRIALLGANGNGKSTLMKLLAGRLQPQAGDMVRASKLRIGYFAQHQSEELDLTITPYIDLMRRLSDRKEDARESVVRGRLGQFGFSKDLSDTKIGSLSGGEKARLLFCFMSLDKPHMLLLDEPTNHLDIDARGALVQALNAYEGAVVIVSHDPHMLELVADRLWLVNDGAVSDFDGDLTDYRKFVVDRQRASRRGDKQKKSEEKAEERKKSASAREQLAPLAKTIETAEKVVAKLNSERKRIEAQMADADFYKDAARAQRIQREHGALLKKLETEEASWVKAQEKYDIAKNVS